MTRAEMTADLQARIGSEPEITGAQLQGWIDQALRQFCMEYDFSWLEKHQTASTVASQADYDLPDDFKRAFEVRVDATDDTPNIYRYVPHETRSQVETSEKTYSIFGDVMTLHPVPDATTSNNIDLWYIRKATNMTMDSDSPSDSGIANMPEDYHEALVIYAFGTYQGYDEEHDEQLALMGNMLSPTPGTYAYYVQLAKREDTKKKKGMRRKLRSKQSFTGFTEPNKVASSTVLRI